MNEHVTLAAGDISVRVAPGEGGRIAQITVAGTDLLVDRGDLPAGAGPAGPLAWGCYPMVPWAGRIRDGRLAVGGRVVDLPRSLGPHAIHGVGFAAAWHVERATPTGVELGLTLPTDVRWPFGGRAHQRVAIDTDGLVLTMTVTAGAAAFPASIGWHPWFRKPDSIEFAPRAMYRRDPAGITVADLVGVSQGPWDDCFVNDRPIRVAIGGRWIELTSDCTDWVVYDEPPHATCIEPQTSPPDAVNFDPRTVEPGGRLGAWYRIRPIA